MRYAADGERIPGYASSAAGTCADGTWGERGAVPGRCANAMATSSAASPAPARETTVSAPAGPTASLRRTVAVTPSPICTSYVSDPARSWASPPSATIVPCPALRSANATSGTSEPGVTRKTMRRGRLFDEPRITAPSRVYEPDQYPPDGPPSCGTNPECMRRRCAGALIAVVARAP